MPEAGSDSGESSEHALACPSCAAQMRRHRAVEAGLRMLAAQMRPVEAPERVEAGLLAAFRAQKRQSTRTARLQWWPVLSWAAAAAVMVAGSILLLHPARTPSPARRAAPGTVEMASAVDSSEVDGSTTINGQDGFIPLPNAEKLDPDEDVNVVRMEVPRSAMMAVGLAVSADRVSELVEADVALGPDGMARAIRFIDE